MANIAPTMNISNLESPPSSATFGQDASFRLEQPIGAMSISPSGRDVVLASKEGLHIIDLDSPYSPPRHLPHRTPWEVADVQWSPFAIRDYWVVSTSNQKALVWNVGVSGWRDAIEFVLHAHTRAITDINFSAHHPDILATCAVDSFVHAWDLRAPTRPAFSFSDWFAGATQVKWSRQDEHVIASSHDRFLHIWDKRKGACPARTIEAHGTKIYGVDWNRFEPTKIVTCSLDRTIKFWNTDNPEDVPERVIETSFPVWRARHTPFGWGLCAMPQRGDTNLYLYDRRAVDGVYSSGAVPAVSTFSGHKGQVREFLWRSRGTIKEGVDHRDFQLVSWGTDGELRLHTVGDDTFNAIGYEKGVSKPLRLNFTRRNARYRTFRDDFNESHSPIEVSGRSESNQSHYPTISSRGRHSTNIGMSRLPVAQFRGWLHGGKRERRTGMHGKSTLRQDINPIAWMKNVKIVSWNSDSIADEITHVGDRFKKLEWEVVDIGGRKAVMSLQGPWGENNAAVYTRVDFRFPKAYPKDAPAIITIHKTSSIEDAVYRMLSTEIRTIAETYASRQRGCIEAIVRYLLHEQTMEQIVSWLLEESTADAKDLSAVEMTNDLSSDSDDDNLDSNQDPSSSSAYLRVPLAKGCGAIWSPTGALLCFFPQKRKENTSVSSNWSATGPVDSQSNRLFENFGRLQTSSPARRSGNGTQPTVDDTASEISDLTSTFSTSSSSSSSESEVGIRDRFTPYRNTVNFGMRARSGSLDRSNKSTTLDGTKIEEESRLNFISIHHEFKDLLPAQKSLAEKYKMFGQRSKVCEHNASVADAAALPDVASVWRLVALIVQNKVPLELLKSTERLDVDIAVIARYDAVRLRKKDSGIDLSFDNPETNSMGSIRWGNSPLGSRYLIAAIFSYFERNADIQMLAMLSCILSSQQDSELHVTWDGKRSPVVQNLPYQPSMEVADSVIHSQNGSYNKFTLAVTKPSIAAKLEDMIVPSLREPHNRRGNTATIAHRPSVTYAEDGRENAIDVSASGSTVAKTNTVSASTSPEDSRFSRRSNSGVPFAASKASLSALAQSFQHSPPSNNSTAGSSLKKFSPSANSGWAGTLFGSTQNSRASRASQAPSEANSDDASGSNLRGSMSLANLQDLRRESQRLRNSRGNSKPTSVIENDKSGMTGKSKKRRIKMSLHNQSKFDLDGHADVPLLDPELGWKYRMYQSAYADQLGAWGLFLQQAELLQFAGGQRDQLPGIQRGSTTSGTATPKLEISRCCIECGSPFAPIEKNGVPIGWHCTSISCHITNEKVSKSQICSICQQVVRGLSIPCLQCGHMTCYDCAQAWFGDNIHSDTEDTNQEEKDTRTINDNNPPSNSYCPAGCGCHCPTLQTINVPYPQSLQLEHDTTQQQQQPLLAPSSTHRHSGASSTRSQRHKSEATPTGPPGPGPDTTPSAAMMALSRSRAASAATVRTAAVADTDSHGHTHGYGHGDVYNADDLVPWSGGKFTSLSRGVGGGLSRGLSNRSSDATIRKL